MTTGVGLRVACFCTAALLLGAVGSVQAAPQLYSFLTGVALPQAGNSISPPSAQDLVDDASLVSTFAGTSISGTFMYDPAAPLFSTLGDGSKIYASISNSPFKMLSAQISGGTIGTIAFSDPRGFTQVGNDTFPLTDFSVSPPVTTKVDFFQLSADSSSPSGTNHNISGFTLGDFSLYNSRMFWIEGQMTPELIPDFLSSSDLPGAPPTFHGVMSIDFIKDGLAGGQQYDIFFDGLTVAAVPEPETYAMLLAGLGLLGLMVRNRKLKEVAAA